MTDFYMEQSHQTISKQNSGLNHQLIHCKKIINIFCDLWSYREIIVTVASFSVTLEHGPHLTFYEAEPSASNKERLRNHPTDESEEVSLLSVNKG